MATKQNERLSPNAVFVTPSEASCDVFHEDIEKLTRKIIYNLLEIAARMNDARDELARMMGLKGPQYSVIMAIARFQMDKGVNVGSVADLLLVTPAFVTAECRKLIDRNLITKRRDPDDGRGVLLSLTPAVSNQISLRRAT